MIKFIYDNEADIPAHVKQNYALTDGKWVLQVDGAVAKATLDAFRENNIALTKENDVLKQTFKGVDATEYQSLKARAAELEEGKLIKKEGLDAAVELRTKAMKEAADKQISELTTSLTNARGEMGKLKIDSALIEHGTKAGLLPTAAIDFVNRARSVFSLDENGQVVALEADGKTKKFGAQGTPMSIAEYVGNVAKDKDFAHLFAPSGGTGAPGAGNRTAPAANPFKTATMNLTEQAKITRDNPALAQQLRAEAGTPVPA